jgi:hypothetical protein
VSGFQEEDISAPKGGGAGANIVIDQPLKGVPEHEVQLNKLKLTSIVLKLEKTSGTGPLGALKLQAST